MFISTWPGLSDVNSKSAKVYCCNIFSVLLTIMLFTMAGLFSNHGPLYFVNTKVSFSKMGLACHIAKIHSEVNCKSHCCSNTVNTVLDDDDDSSSYEKF